jgi:hypothetical protein
MTKPYSKVPPREDRLREDHHQEKTTSKERQPLREDNLKILKGEYLSNHSYSNFKLKLR